MVNRFFARISKKKSKILWPRTGTRSAKPTSTTSAPALSAVKGGFSYKEFMGSKLPRAKSKPKSSPRSVNQFRSLDKSKLAADEDLLLLRTTLKIGFGRWNEIAESLNQQTCKTFKRNYIHFNNRMRYLLLNVRDMKIVD